MGFNGKVLLGRSVRVLPEAKRHTPRGGADAKGDALSAPAVEARPRPLLCLCPASFLLSFRGADGGIPRGGG